MGARAQHTTRYRQLCELLRGWRLGAGFSQRDLAGLLGKPPSYVHKCEVADRRIDPLEFVAWCRACGVSRARAVADVERLT
jgi:hypothetical protein